MQNLWEIIVLAIVQGIGEFLPISSSGHINVVNDWMVRLGSVPLKEPLMVNILLHFGTLFAVLVVFRKRIIALLKEDVRVIPLIIVGSIPAVIVGIPMEKYCESLLESPLLTGFCFLGTAALLLYSAKQLKTQETKADGLLYKNMSYKTALIIGSFQAIAILPGFSRSGFTIVGGLLCKLRRDEAATFSFLLAIPVIGGGGLLHLAQLVKNYEPSQTEGLLVYLTGMVLSFLVGVVALVWLLKWLQKGNLHYFAYWLLVIGPITIVLSLFYPVENKEPQPEPANISVSLFESPVLVQESVQERNREIVARWKAERDGQIVENNDNQAGQPHSIFQPNTGIDDDDDYDDFYDDEDEEEVNQLPPPTPRPLVDCPEERLITLDETQLIWITRDRKQVVLMGNICLRTGMLELFACRRGSKEHESVVSVQVKPFLVHAALLAVGAEPGSPAKFSPEFVPPHGQEIRIDVLWTDENGNLIQRKAQELVAEIDYDDHDQEGYVPKQMSVPFVFTGSFFQEFEGEESGRTITVYMADATGELFGLSNFPASMLDVPIRSSDSNDELLFEPYTERIPELGTPVTLILTPF